jgi:hypothetical protein
VVDFGARTLIIGGALTVPPGMLQFTASTILVHGRIEAPGASVTLIANNGAADLNTEIDVAAGSLDVSATGNIDVKTRLKAKGGGSVTLTAGGILETDGTAVIEVEPGGTIALSGDGGVTTGGKMLASESTVQIDSSAGVVTVNQDIRASGDAPSAITVNGATGVVVNHAIIARNATPPSSITLASTGGDVELHGIVSVGGFTAGTIVVQAPAGTIGPRGVDAKGKFDGGSVAMTGATVALLGKIVAKGGINGGSIQLKGSTAVTLVGADLEVTSKVNGGAVSILGDAGSGNIVVDGIGIKASSGSGTGSTVVVSAPAGSVSLRAKINATSKGTTSGSISVDGMGPLTIGPKSILDVDGHGPGGEIRMNQTGNGLFSLNATCEARDDGTIEALAPAGSLTAVGRYRAGPTGCVGFSAPTLNTSNAVADVPVTASCP